MLYLSVSYYFGGRSCSAKYLVAFGKRNGSGKSGVPYRHGFKQSLIAWPNARRTAGSAATATAAPSTSSTPAWPTPSLTNRSMDAAIVEWWFGVGLTNNRGFCCSISLRRLLGNPPRYASLNVVTPPFGVVPCNCRRCLTPSRAIIGTQSYENIANLNPMSSLQK